jgi:hypothetical protein
MIGNSLDRLARLIVKEKAIPLLRDVTSRLSVPQEHE